MLQAAVLVRQCSVIFLAASFHVTQDINISGHIRELTNRKWIWKCMLSGRTDFECPLELQNFCVCNILLFFSLGTYSCFFFVYRWCQTFDTQQDERLFLYHKFGPRRSFSYTSSWKIFKVSLLFYVEVVIKTVSVQNKSKICIDVYVALLLHL